MQPAILRVLKLFAVIFALTIPYVVFAVYLAFRYPAGRWPDWAGYTLLAWFVANFLIFVAAAKRIAAKAPPPTPTQRALAKPMSIVAVVISSVLVLYWVGFFLFGLIAVIRGKIELRSALAPGAFLLFFIVLFGWGIVRGVRNLRQPPPAAS